MAPVDARGRSARGRGDSAASHAGAIDAVAAARALRERSGRGAVGRLPEALAPWVDAARDAAAAAYAPYSGLAVGACVLAADGRVAVGCNVESASFGLTQCAERAAVAAARVQGLADLRLVVLTSSAGAIPPCGACRQVLFELAPQALVVSVDEDGAARAWTAQELLPDAFDGSELTRDDA